MRQKHSFKKKIEGQALVEFALVLPIIIFLVLGMIEYGWLLNAKLTLNSAARDGVRLGIVLNLTGDERKNKVLDEVENAIDISDLNIDRVNSDVYPDEDPATNKYDIVVKIQASIEPIIGLYEHDTVTMTTVARMRKE